MNIEHFDNYNTLSVRGAELVMGEIRKKKDLLFCTATGSSPDGVYRILEGEGKEHPGLFQELRIIKLDEWWGLPAGSPATCEAYLRERLLDPLGIREDRYISFHSDAGDPYMECERIRKELDSQGPIDVALLGIGRNGHIGLNEPGETLEPFCHPVELTHASRQHGMLAQLESRPTIGMTLGMREILSSRVVVLLAAGEDKTEAIRGLLTGKITTGCPASFLWLHPRVHCLVQHNQNPTS